MHAGGGKRQRRRRWKSHFPKRSNTKRKHNTPSKQIRQSGSIDEMVLSLLLAASGRSLLSEYDNAVSENAAIAATATDGEDNEDCVGIRLAEYSTVFENTKMSCSVLLVRTIGGAEAEVRVLSSRVEHDSLEPTSSSSSFLSTWPWRWWRSSGKNLSSISRPSDSASLSISRHSNFSLTN
jgi:hypothetical protein